MTNNDLPSQKKQKAIKDKIKEINEPPTADSWLLCASESHQENCANFLYLVGESSYCSCGVGMMLSKIYKDVEKDGKMF